MNGATMRKILITGVAGFLGSHLAHFFLEKGNIVSGIDKIPVEEASNISPFKVHPNFRYKLIDLNEGSDLASEITDVDEIYLLASMVGVSRVINDPFQTINSTLSQVKSLEKVTSRQKVFFASTSEVYGKTICGVPSKETDDLVLGSPEKPRWSYAVSKLLAEHFLLSLSAKSKFTLRIARFFNLVGPRQNLSYGAVVPNFVQNVLKGREIKVYGDGLQTRSFCHVLDAVAGVEALMTSHNSKNAIYNLGSSSAMTILELAKVVNHTLGGCSQVKFVPYQDVMPLGFEEILHRVPDVALIQKDTGWKSRLGLVEIIRDTADYLKTKV